MHILYNNECIGFVITNHSVTKEEAIDLAFGLTQAELEYAYNEKVEFIYIDDNGLYQIDYKGIEIINS